MQESHDIMSWLSFFIEILSYVSNFKLELALWI